MEKNKNVLRRYEKYKIENTFYLCFMVLDAFYYYHLCLLKRWICVKGFLGLKIFHRESLVSYKRIKNKIR